MASRAFHDLLLHCQDNLSRNGRGTFSGLVALLLFHLAVITPFADAGRRKADASADRQRLASVGPALEDLQHRLRSAHQASLEPMDHALADFTEGLALDLQRLEASRWQWQQERPTASESDDGTSLATSDALESGLQMSAPPRGVVPLAIDDTRRQAFAEAPNRYALLSLLEPLVNEEILAPRLQTLQRAWTSDALPPMSSGLDALGSEVSQLRGLFPEGDKAWDALSASLTELAREAREWQPQAPPQAFWWASPESQAQLALGLGSFEDNLRRPASLAHLSLTAEQVSDRLAAVHRAWERRRAEIPAADAGPGGFLGLDLDGFTPLFPLTLGLLLAAGLWRRSRLLTDLARVTEHAISQGSPTQLASWFGSLVAAAPVASGSLERSSLTPLARRARRRLFVQLLLAWTWLATAGYQLYGPPGADWRPWSPAAIGALLVLLAGGHRLHLSRRAFQALEEVLEPTREDDATYQTTDIPTDPPPFVDLDDGDLVETTLRR